MSYIFLSWPTNCTLWWTNGPCLGTLTEVSDATFEGSFVALGNSCRAFFLFCHRQALVDAPRHGCSVGLGCPPVLGTSLGDCHVCLYPLLGAPCLKLACLALYAM